MNEPFFSLFFYSTKNGPAFPGGRIWSSSRLRTALFFLLDKGNDAKQPCAKGGLEFFLPAPPIKRIYGFAAAGKRNVAARGTCFAAILRHELHQQTFGAGLRMIRIVKIKTGGRILENKIRTSRKALRFSVPPELTKASSARKTFRTSRLSGIGRSPEGLVSRREEVGGAGSHQTA